MTSVGFEALAREVAEGRDATDAASELVAAMSDDEVIATLHGDMGFWECLHEADFVGYNTHPYVAGENARLGIPGIRFADGPRGVVVGRSTCFPVALARGATWDPAFEERVTERIGAEAQSYGANLWAGICINLVRHPAWGRSQESYGEDPVHVGAMGAAAATGASRHVMTCVKHFAVNSIEKPRHRVDVVCDDDVLHEVYLPHFRQVVDAGVDSVMSAYNKVNGEWAGHSRPLLTDILRTEWDFDGFVMSDFFLGIRDSVAAVEAGMDLEMPCAEIHPRGLRQALADETLERSDLERSAVRILSAQLSSWSRWSRPSAVVPADALGLELAEESAVRSAVLLRNETVDGGPLLPLDVSSIRRVLVVGALADVPVTGDRGSSDVRAPSVITFLEAVRAALPDVQIDHEPSDPAAAARLAVEADVVIAYVSYSDTDQGESFDMYQNGLLESLGPEAVTDDEIRMRREIHENLARLLEPDETGRVLMPSSDRPHLFLPESDVALLRAAAGSNHRTVAVVATGNAVIMPWAGEVASILVQWFAGARGGAATMRLLLGLDAPSGRLPITFPSAANTMPPFDMNADVAHYDRWYGYRLLDRAAERPAYPLGFGLTYGTTEVVGAELIASDDSGWEIAVRVRNHSSRPLGDVIQVYGATELSDSESPARVLTGFGRVEIPAASEVTLVVTAYRGALDTWRQGERRRPSGPVRLEVARYHGDPEAHLVHVEA
jgi:beta-glucosidase